MGQRLTLSTPVGLKQTGRHGATARPWRRSVGGEDGDGRRRRLHASATDSFCEASQNGEVELLDVLAMPGDAWNGGARRWPWG
jgi:hypothetical protein